MRDDKTGTDEELNTPDTARTIPTRRRKEPKPPATDEWRPPASLNPWARAFGDSLPDEPYMGSNKKPKQLSNTSPTESGIGRHGGRQATPHIGRHAVSRMEGTATMIDANTSRQVEELYRSDDWADLCRHANIDPTADRTASARPTAEPLLQRVGRTREITDDCGPFQPRRGRSGNPRGQRTARQLRQAIIRYAGTPARLLQDMARTESNTRLLQMLVESGNSARTPSTCAAGTRRTADWRQACCRKPRDVPAPPSQRPRLVAIQEERRRIRQARPQGPTT